MMDAGTGAHLVAETVSAGGQGLAFWLSIVIFAVTFIIILSERIHRAVIGLIGAVVMVGVLMFFTGPDGVTSIYNPDLAKEALDFNTLGLLFGMMLIVAILETTGAFQYLGIKVAKKTNGDMWKLLIALGTLTTVLSMILDNVTTIILIAPITIVIARILGINATPILMTEAILSNTGGVATLVGDPPNIMIGSYAGFSFNDFLIHSLPVVFFAWIATLLTIRLVFRKELKVKPSETAIEELKAMDENKAITDPVTLKKILFVLGLVVILFFVHHTLHIEPSMVAIIGAALALILVSATKDPQKILEKVELSVLLFFGALFVIVGGLEHTGVLEQLAGLIASGAEDNLLLTAIIILWVSAILSALVDNIPMTVAMLPIIGYFQYTYQAPGSDIVGLPGVDLLWWALVFGVGFGGNASPIGSTANVIVVSKSEQTDNPISFITWIKGGATTAAAGLIIATVGLYVLSIFIGVQ